MRWILRPGAGRRAVALAWLGALWVLGAASAVELRDAELVAAGSPVLQNAMGTVRLEDARLGRLGPPVFAAPEPGAFWQLSCGIGLLAFLAGRRRRRSPVIPSRRVP